MRRDQNAKNTAHQLPRGERRGAICRCKICRKRFWVKTSRLKRGNVQCCSNRCRGILITRQNSVRRKCKQCRQWFSRKRSKVGKPGLGTYCSHACLCASMKRRKVAVCKLCQKIFEYRPSDGARVFCSTKCTIQGRKAVFLKTNCGYCGQEFEYYEKVPAKFCSPVCRKIVCGNRCVERTRFKPSYIQFLLDYKGEVCPFVNCGEPTIERKGWCACKKHIAQIINALSCKRRYRDQQLLRQLQETEMNHDKGKSKEKDRKSRPDRRSQTDHHTPER